jgi:hypothetical protein
MLIQLHGRLAEASLIALGVAVAAMFQIPTAKADGVILDPCGASGLTQPFVPWGDPAWYVLAPGGDFQTPAWTLSPGAERVAGSDPYATGSSRSLSLSAGSWGQSPLTCVDATYPSLRFFIGGTGTVAVGIVYDGRYIAAGVAAADGGWQPTPVMVAQSALPALLSGGCAQVSVLITALSGNPVVDDVYVDPWNRG